MYNEYFGFKEAPFSIAPDPRYLYMTTQHREALAHLVYGLNSEGGCILLTGEVGTGKTTICRCLLEQIPERANIALVLNPKVNEIELLETICDELKIEYPDSNNSIKTYTDRIYQYLIDTNRKDQETVLIIDEAQNLDSKVLEQLRLLTNLETNQRKLLQIIILGQPELLEILARSEMRQLAQRITARFHLQPLDSNEVKAYINHRLAVAGQNVQLFPESSIKQIYKLSKGVPRLINILCDRALLGAYVENQYVTTPSIIKKASKEVFGELKNVEHNQQQKPKRIAAAASLLFITVVSAAYYFYNNQNHSIEKTNAEVTTGNEEINATQISSTVSTLDIDESISSVEIESAPEEALTTEKTAEEIAPIVTNKETQAASLNTLLVASKNKSVSAYSDLFERWGKTFNKTSGITACTQSKKFQLYCLHKQGNINSLKRHNRPAVLTLMDNSGTPVQATISSINEDMATIHLDGTSHKVTLSDLDKHWFGQYILLWRKPEHYSSAITPGDQGEIISWLATQLNPSDPLTRDTRIYDDALVNSIKTFQRSEGLTADGIVGPVTIIHLNDHAGNGSPLLTKNNLVANSAESN